jgi:predicted GNAT family N-acyltransferase
MIREIPIAEVLALRQKVLWPDKDIDFVRTPNDDTGIHFGIFLENQWISCVSIFEEEHQRAVFRKFATLADFQGKGYGSHLLEYSFSYLQQRNCKTVYCSARFEKQGFYKKFGMIPKGEMYLKNGLNYIQMERDFE